MATREQIHEYYRQPFTPTANLTTEQRAASALEYIAFHMGQITTRLSAIEDQIKHLVHKK